MPFSTSELSRIRAELGMNVLEVGADVYVGVHQILEVVVQNFIAAEVATTTTLGSAIAATSTPASQTITLASPTGFASGDRIVLDVDFRREWATIGNLSGNDATVLLSKAHEGTIPVALEGPIQIARDALFRIAETKAEIASTFGTGAVRKVDEVEFFQTGGTTQFANLGAQLAFWRSELAALFGIPNLWERKRSAGSRMAVY